MTRLTLYGTSNCHLCELAKAEVQAFIPFAPMQLELSEVDIVSDDALYEALELKIPLLENAETGMRIEWPFDTAGILSIL